MQIVITGASGFLGRQLVPYLQSSQVELLLVGRDAAALQDIFPGVPSSTYEDILHRAKDFDLLLHLAAVNNDKLEASAEQFTAVNVDLAVATCLAAREAGIRRFAYASSTHALDTSKRTLYAKSKRAASIALEHIDGIEVHTLYLAAVYGEHFPGKLAPLNGLPKALRQACLVCLRALKPMVDFRKVGRTALTLASDRAPSPKYWILTDGQDQNVVFNTVKRLLDITAAVTIIALLWWAMIIIWVTIRTQSRGPGIFRQARVGRNGRVFTCYKFRTMYVSTPNVETHRVSSTSVTGFGTFLRRSKLDELPQVLNIILNQMSLVGPRPCLPNQAELIAEREARGVLSAKPGITGLAQINKIDMSNPAALAEWDQRYLQLQAILLDLKIIVQTVLGNGAGDNVR